MTRTVVFLVGCVLLWARSGETCSSVQIFGIRPDPNEVAIAGRIVGYVRSEATIDDVPNALGVELDVTDVAPDGRVRGKGRIFPLATLPDCKSASFEPADLSRLLPIGRQVVIIGEPSITDGAWTIAAGDFPSLIGGDDVGGVELFEIKRQLIRARGAPPNQRSTLLAPAATSPYWAQCWHSAARKRQCEYYRREFIYALSWAEVGVPDRRDLLKQFDAVIATAHSQSR